MGARAAVHVETLVMRGTAEEAVVALRPDHVQAGQPGVDLGGPAVDHCLSLLETASQKASEALEAVMK